MQGVTLGGTGKEAGDRHPKIQEGVLIGAGATILGNIVIGRGSMIAAGSLVLKDVPAHRYAGFLELYCPLFYVGFSVPHMLRFYLLQYGGWNACKGSGDVVGTNAKFNNATR